MLVQAILIVRNRIHFERLKVAVILRIHRLHSPLSGTCTFIWLYERSQAPPHLQNSVQSRFAEQLYTFAPSSTVAGLQCQYDD